MPPPGARSKCRVSFRCRSFSRKVRCTASGQRSNRMKTILWLPLIPALCCPGCLAPGVAPEAVVPVSNRGYAVERLFTDDRGNTIYRFWDGGQNVYYASGPGGPQVLGTSRPASTNGTRV